ncbi:hypothetical protein T492DRAFT_1080700 [Pavlovales sp. CCMP2436]|nr:hypothetical protein T492DRAFT_1080700 [Pavlovales sp. CCMP2436]
MRGVRPILRTSFSTKKCEREREHVHKLKFGQSTNTFQRERVFKLGRESIRPRWLPSMDPTFLCDEEEHGWFDEAGADEDEESWEMLHALQAGSRRAEMQRHLHRPLRKEHTRPFVEARRLESTLKESLSIIRPVLSARRAAERGQVLVRSARAPARATE